MDRLINRRINDNLLKVENESSQVKSLLSLGVNTSSDNSQLVEDSLNDMDVYSRHTTRNDLLRTAIILGTSRNTYARENIMNVIRIRLGKIKDKDYKFIADLIYLKNPQIVERVNNYLCQNLVGFSELHGKYFRRYYSI